MHDLGISQERGKIHPAKLFRFRSQRARKFISARRRLIA
jgi:hypothetical protein